MKKTYPLFISVFFCFHFFSAVKAQGVVEIGIISPVSNDPSMRTIYGGGIDLAGFSAPINFIKPSYSNYRYQKAASPLCLRFGASLNMAFMGSKNFKDVPLSSPETGNARVNFSNGLYSMNVNARLSSSCFKGKVIPYLEGFAGWRDFECDMSISPNDHSKSTDSILGSKSGLGIGGTAGFLIRLAPDCYLNAGMTWNHSEAPGKFVDLHSIDRVGNSIEYYTHPSPADFLVFKIGISAYLDDSPNQSSGGGSYHHSSWGGSCHSGGGGHSHISLIGH
jgi:hypothetical protein